MEAKIYREKNKNGEIISVTVTISRDSAYERRRFGTEEEAMEFVRRLKETEAEGRR